MSHRASESQKIFTEVVTITSAAGATSLRYDMGDAYKITFAVAGGTAAASTVTAPTYSIRQSGDEAAATSTTITGATGTLYAPTTAFEVVGAKSALVTMTTASTDGETVIVAIGGNSYTMTRSTAPSTIATALSFGTTSGSTAGTQMAEVTNNFSSVINNSTLSKWITATTLSTAVVRISVNDSAVSSGVGLLSTGALILPSYEKYQSMVSVLSEDLNGTSKYVYCVVTSADTSVQCAITAIKSGVRYQPPTQVGQVIKST